MLRTITMTAVLGLWVLLSLPGRAEEYPLDVADIPIRDPFIHVDREQGIYYMYAQHANRSGDERSEPRGVEVYRSRDLQRWSEPQQVLDLPQDSWARAKVWAPEVFQYQGRYYLFVTLTGETALESFKKPGWLWNPLRRLFWPAGNVRGTQIFHADSPMGPFKPFADRPHTPLEWMALDGTLYVEGGVPYMVFCHEWVQIVDGTVDLVQLSDDLSQAVGEPEMLFRASEAAWSQPELFFDSHVTDGVFLHRTQTGKLLMIWSSFGEDGYTLGQAMSETGSIKGPWRQIDEPLFSENGGHGMLFRSLQNQLMLVLHQPNDPSGKERLQLFPVDDSGDLLVIQP